jgi:hypothetical protein
MHLILLNGFPKALSCIIKDRKKICNCVNFVSNDNASVRASEKIGEEIC